MGKIYPSFIKLYACTYGIYGIFLVSAAYALEKMSYYIIKLQKNYDVSFFFFGKVEIIMDLKKQTLYNIYQFFRAYQTLIIL